MKKNKQIKIIDWGTIEYHKALSQQQELLNKIIEQKLRNRNLSSELQSETPNFLIFCEHPHVFTMGSRASQKHLLMTQEELKNQQISYFQTNRGGDITYHGKGQLVVYPILDLDNFLPDIHHYIRTLEEVIILALKPLGITSQRIDKLTGVWIKPKNGVEKKICAIGVKISRWVTMHGLALNVNTDLSYFNHIIPCGISGKPVTSIAKELSYSIDAYQVKKLVKTAFLTLFNATPIYDPHSPNS